jgi:hypothetical protein
MKVLKWPRRQGKTTMALEILKDNPRAILLCMSGIRCSELINENKDLEDRIGSVWSYKTKTVGRNIDEVIIDDGDCIPLSHLIECINYFQERQIKITITTSV